MLADQTVRWETRHSGHRLWIMWARYSPGSTTPPSWPPPAPPWPACRGTWVWGVSSHTRLSINMQVLTWLAGLVLIFLSEETLPILSPEAEKGSSSLSELSVHFQENYQLFRNIVKSLGKTEVSQTVVQCRVTNHVLGADSVCWCSTTVTLYVLTMVLSTKYTLLTIMFSVLLQISRLVINHPFRLFII